MSSITRVSLAHCPNSSSARHAQNETLQGIGFAKDLDGNLALMREAEELRKLCFELPFLYGPSRKGFIGKITGETSPERRDYGTIAACLACIKGGGCTILRVHNVGAVKQALQVFDAIRKE